MLTLPVSIRFHRLRARVSHGNAKALLADPISHGLGRTVESRWPLPKGGRNTWPASLDRKALAKLRKMLGSGKTHGECTKVLGVSVRTEGAER